MKNALLSAAFSALLARQCDANAESITAGGIEISFNDVEGIVETLFERDRDRPSDNGPGATSRTCFWTGTFCSNLTPSPDPQLEATPFCIDGPNPFYFRCLDEILVTGAEECDSGCEFTTFTDDNVVGRCGAPGGPSLAAADLNTFIECDNVFPFVWSEECEEANVKIVLAAGAGEAYAQEVREEYMCRRQSTEEACNVVALEDCPPAAEPFSKCSGKGVLGVLCCELGTECFKKNDFYGQCRAFDDVPGGWDGEQQDCFL